MRAAEYALVTLVGLVIAIFVSTAVVGFIAEPLERVNAQLEAQITERK